MLICFFAENPSSELIQEMKKNKAEIKKVTIVTGEPKEKNVSFTFRRNCKKFIISLDISAEKMLLDMYQWYILEKPLSELMNHIEKTTRTRVANGLWHVLHKENGKPFTKLIIADLVSLSSSDLLKYPHLGKKSIGDLRRALWKFNLDLADYLREDDLQSVRRLTK